MNSTPQTPFYANQIPFIAKKTEELVPGDVFLHIGYNGLEEIEVESVEKNLIIPVDKSKYSRLWSAIYCVIRNNNTPKVPRSLSEVEVNTPYSQPTILGYSATELPYTVFPSEEKTISVMNDHADGGTRYYNIRNCTGFHDGNSQYKNNFSQTLQFVQRDPETNEFSEGIQDEQLVYILLDRTEKLNARFPSLYNEVKVNLLNKFLLACRSRIEDRMSRGVMGEHKK